MALFFNIDYGNEVPAASAQAPFAYRYSSPPPAEQAREAAAQFAGLLFESAFRSLAAPLGFYGDVVLASVARSLAERERGGLTDGLARALRDAGR
jgi:hypothetical protein